MTSLHVATLTFDVGSFLRNRAGAEIYELTDEVNLDCIFCHSKQKMYVNKERKKWICHKCGERGDLVDLVESVLQSTTLEAIKFIKDNRSRTLLDLGFKEAEEIVGPEITLPPLFKKLSFPETDENRKYWRYLKKRGVLASTALDYKLGYVAQGTYRRRIVIPVYWFDKLVTWVARSLSNDVAKTKLTPKDNEQSSYLLNLDRLRGREHVVLVEGPFDMLKIPDLAVASFGKRISRQQVALLTHAGAKRITVAYDSDALQETWRTAAMLSERFDVQIAELPPGEDPGSLPDVVTRDLIRHARGFDQSDHLKFRLGLTA